MKLAFFDEFRLGVVRDQLIFDVSRVTVCDDLELVERKSLRPLGLFTMMRFAKANAAVRVAAE